jgi:hypothetical protein
MPPSDAGGGVLGHGGNCLGTVRKCGQPPERVNVVAFVAASLRDEVSEGESKERTTTNPSRWRESRYGVGRIEVLVVIVVVAIV